LTTIYRYEQSSPIKQFDFLDESRILGGNVWLLPLFEQGGER